MENSIFKIILLPLHTYNYFKQKLRLFILVNKGVKIGKDTYISPKAYIDTFSPKSIKIGENCNIARNSMILCHSGETLGGPRNIWDKYGGKRKFADVNIGNNVFIGANSIILPGVKIGNNTIIGCSSVINKDIPSGKVVAGNPFKIIMSTKDFLKKKCDYFDETDWNKFFSD